MFIFNIVSKYFYCKIKKKNIYTTITSTRNTTNNASTASYTTKKLTKWAQVAARSVPSNIIKAEKQQESKVNKVVFASADSKPLLKKETSISTISINSNSSNSDANNNNNNHTRTNNKKCFNKYPFNRNEVRSYMNDLFI